ncbi:MAG: hypothetical protein LBT96_02870 [Campylobacteraceae bacterium]|jgi:hypothetical protein|nr:hypothetical protein [Campylobacteraceae bacterium]
MRQTNTANKSKTSLKINREKILIEEVKVVQDIIKRMASNSFYIKGWTITLVFVVLVFRAKDINVSVAYLPLFCFWFLDAYYLRQERLFRKVHDWITKYRLENDDNVFNLNPMRFNEDVASIKRIMFSISILPFYGAIFLVLSFAVISQYFCWLFL